MISIIDGYVDEPTCLGVPPYISPYPRYIAGSIWDIDPSLKVFYITIDNIRKDHSIIETIRKSDMVIIIAGVTVPGRYLSGLPMSPNEIIRFFSDMRKPLMVLCGPAARYGFGVSGGKYVCDVKKVEDIFDIVIKGDAEIIIPDLLENGLKIDKIDNEICRHDPYQIASYAVKGASICTQHPFYPDYLIAEIETYRGCPRSITGGCSFCSESSRGLPMFRSIDDILSEIEELYKYGVRHFRLGNQPCLFSYMAKDTGKEEYPKPNPEAIDKLFKGVRRVAPDLLTLHIDNVNPGVVFRYPYESKRIIKSIIRYHTPGDVAALGVESVDPVVIKNNNLKVSSDELLDVIKLFNELGSGRGDNGLPELLPGLNFVFGLIGESKETYKLNYLFLKDVVDRGLLLRRINMRQVMPIPGTRIGEIGDRIIKKHKTDFHRFKHRVQMDIEHILLQRLIPKGTILKRVYAEMYEGKLTFGRQIGSYPLLVGIVGCYPLRRFYDVYIIDHGFRSVTALVYPVNINTASSEVIEALPGIGKGRAKRIMIKRPYKSKEEFVESLDDKEQALKLIDIITIKD
ncbi:MAG: radical SAM protein [Candidatus Thermoplasmatota archaeon]